MRDNNNHDRVYHCAVCGKQFTTHPYYAGYHKAGDAWAGIATCSRDCQRAQLAKFTQAREVSDADAD